MKWIKLCLFLSSLFAFANCQKDKSIYQFENDKRLLGRTSYVSITLNPTYGFLEFANLEHVQEFDEFLKSYSHELIQESLAEDGFTSLGATLYNSTNCDYYEIPLDEEMSSYVVNTDGVVMLDSVVFKISADSLYILTLRYQDLSSTNYSKLVNEEIDEDYMNRISIFQDEGFDLNEFVAANPTGYIDSESEPTERGKKWFGTDKTILPEDCNPDNTATYNGTQCSVACRTKRETKRYFFGWTFTSYKEVGNRWKPVPSHNCNTGGGD